MINSTILALYFVLCIHSCTSYKFLIEDVKNGMHLEKAKEENVNEFFQKRMTNRSMYKSGEIQRRWNIITEDSNYVFYGFTQHKNFSEVDIPVGALNEFYKVNKQTLLRIFPDYKNVQGYHIIDTALNKMNRKKDNQLFHDNCTAGFNEWKFDLNNDNYLVEYGFYCSDEIFPKSKNNKIYEYKFVLSQKDLSVLEQKRTDLIK